VSSFWRSQNLRILFVAPLRLQEISSNLYNRGRTAIGSL